MLTDRDVLERDTDDIEDFFQGKPIASSSNIELLPNRLQEKVS